MDVETLKILRVRLARMCLSIEDVVIALDDWMQEEETPPSAPATTPQADAPSGVSTSSWTYYLAKAVPNGGSEITATVTFRGDSLTPGVGLALNDLWDAGWRLTNPMTLDSLLVSGLTPSTPEAPEAGQSASGLTGHD